LPNTVFDSSEHVYHASRSFARPKQRNRRSIVKRAHRRTQPPQRFVSVADHFDSSLDGQIRVQMSPPLARLGLRFTRSPMTFPLRRSARRGRSRSNGEMLLRNTISRLAKRLLDDAIGIEV